MQDITIGVSSGGAGGVVGVLITLGFIWAKARLNGKSSADPATTGQTVKLDSLSADHVRHEGILNTLAEDRIERRSLMQQQLKATEDQTELLRERLPGE